MSGLPTNSERDHLGSGSSGVAEGSDGSALPVTVVIAVPGFKESTRDIPGVREIVRQATHAGGEVVAVRSGTDKADTSIKAERLTPEGIDPVEVPNPPPGCLTPHLWQAGIDLARGRIVVLTLAGLTPAEGWLKAHLDAHAGGDWAGVGGPIEASPTASLSDRAIAVSRYSSFLLPFEAHAVHDIAADNASYTRVAIEACRDLIGDGFWEPPVHARLAELGNRLLLSPVPVMHHTVSTGFGAFIAQRISHGFRFGRDRRGKVSALWMVKYFVFCPVLPILLLARVVMRWRSKGRPISRLLALLPALFCFNLAWAMAEVIGTIFAIGRSGKSISQAGDS